MSIDIDVRFLGAERWAAETSVLLRPYSSVPRLVPQHWQDWAAAVIMIPAVAALGPPRPERFATWQDWAQAFNVVVRLLTV